MFTGLVQAMGTVQRVVPVQGATRLRIDASAWEHRPEAGESICVNGCCLTLAEPLQSDGVLSFDVVPQTLRQTTLGSLGVGDRVNLEACCTPNTLLGGHIVQGHVDGVGQVLEVRTEGEHRVRIEAGRELIEYATPRGSVCVDGVSLTLAGVDPRAGWFEVALIPTTLRETTLGMLQAGSRVNLEMDILAKTLIHWARTWQR